jgi:glycosyltransferase involved in cell wall biosynthesis
MRVAHIASGTRPEGGPPGYLHQLERAFRLAATSRHDVLFPPAAVPRPEPAPARLRRLRRSLARLRRAVLGPPRFPRPSAEELRANGGPVDSYMRRHVARIADRLRPSVEAGRAADVLFAHDVYAAEHVLAVRRDDQQVWLMSHAPTPVVLHLAWNYVIPEIEWSALAALPDSRRWVERELAVWQRVDAIVLPSREAGAGFIRADARFAPLVAGARLVLTGASRRDDGEGEDVATLRRRWRLPADRPVGLFLGGADRYRSLDLVVGALGLLPRRGAPRGVVAVAGPPAEIVPRHPRLAALGRVRDVGSLLCAVDFVINVNRFTLFDLSNIEAAEAAKPFLLHVTGGNETFAALGVGCVAIDRAEPAAIAAGLAELFSMDAARRAALGRASRAVYERHLTLDHFRRGHERLYDERGAAAVEATA